MDEIGALQDAHSARSLDMGRLREAVTERLIAAVAAEQEGVVDCSRSRVRGTLNRGALLAVGAAVVVLAVAVPAFGIPERVADFFSAPAAPGPVQRSFASLDEGAPTGMAPGVSGKARSVMDATVADQKAQLWVAPTRSGGFCLLLEDYGGGCDHSRSLSINPSLAARTTSSPVVLFGDVLPSQANRLQLRYADGGGSVLIPLVSVSSPINAAFFVYEIPPSELAASQWPITLEVLGSDGAPLATTTVPSIVRPPG